MDEDEFRKQFMKKSVFRQASSLDLSYVPEKLFCRDEAIKTLGIYSVNIKLHPSVGAKVKVWVVRE